MKIALLGSTGYVGTELLKRCLEQQHQVKVLVRNSQKLGDLSKSVEVVEGDYFDKDKVAQAISGCKVVISTIGPSTKKPENVEVYKKLMAGGMANLVSAMENEKVKKFILIGGAATPVRDNEAFNARQKFIKFLLNLTSKYIISIKTMEASILAKFSFDWIIVRPPVISKGSPTGNVMSDERILYGMKIDIEDLIDFILNQITSDVWLHKAPLVCSMKKQPS